MLTPGYFGFEQRSTSAHSHGHTCWFSSCRLQACQQAQKDAELYGFDEDGEINLPPRSTLPWELDAA